MTGKVPRKKRKCVDIIKAFLKFARVDIFQKVLLQLEMIIDTSKYSWQYVTTCPIYFLKLSNEISTLQLYQKAAIHFPKRDNNDHVIWQERKKKNYVRQCCSCTVFQGLQMHHILNTVMFCFLDDRYKSGIAVNTSILEINVRINNLSLQSSPARRYLQM